MVLKKRHNRGLTKVFKKASHILATLATTAVIGINYFLYSRVHHHPEGKKFEVFKMTEMLTAVVIAEMDTYFGELKKLILKYIT